MVFILSVLFSMMMLVGFLGCSRGRSMFSSWVGWVVVFVTVFSLLVLVRMVFCTVFVSVVMLLVSMLFVLWVVVLCMVIV